MEDLVHDLEHADELTKLDAWPLLAEALAVGRPRDLRFWAAWVVGSAVQNNPKAQVRPGTLFDFLL